MADKTEIKITINGIEIIGMADEGELDFKDWPCWFWI